MVGWEVTRIGVVLAYFQLSYFIQLSLVLCRLDSGHALAVLVVNLPQTVHRKFQLIHPLEEESIEKITKKTISIMFFSCFSFDYFL